MQAHTFHGGQGRHHPHHHHDDDESFHGQHEKKKKKALASANDPETHMHDSQTPPTSTLNTDDTLPTVKLSSTQKAHLSAPYKYSLIAKVLGKKVGYRHLSNHLLRLWSPTGTLDIIDLGHEYFLLKFSHSLDYTKVLEGVPWLIADHYIILRPWVPNFKPSEATITHAAVWVRLPELSIEYYDKEVLQQIGAAIGSLVRIDTVTERRAKGRFARLCIEVDLDRPLLPQIKLGGIWQRVEYEKLHVLCFQCGRVGHRQQDCSYQLSATTTSPNHQHHTNSSLHSTPHETPNTSQNSTSSTTNPSIYGPWLQVPHRHHQPPKDPGQQQKPHVSNCNVTVGTTVTPSGSRFQVLEQENPLDPVDQPPKLPKGKSETTSVSVNSDQQPSEPNLQVPHIEMNVIESNTIETSILAEGTPLALKPKEAITGLLRTPSVSKIVSGLSTPTSSNLEQPPTHQANDPPPLSPTLSNSNVPPPSIPPAPVVTTPTSTELLSHQAIDSVVTKPFHLNQPQPSTLRTGPLQDASVSVSEYFYSQGVQRSVKEGDIKGMPFHLMEPCNEGSPTVFTIESMVSNIDIGVNMSHSISFIPTTIDQTKYPVPPQSCPKKLLSWTCRGASDPKFMRAMKDLIGLHQPSIVLLFEPRISGTDAYQVIKDIGFSGSYRVDPEGFSGGIWILWRNEDVRIEVTPYSSHQIHVSARLLPEPPCNWMLHGVDANTEPHDWMLYEADANTEPLWGPNFFYTSENLNFPQTSQWVHSH